MKTLIFILVLILWLGNSLFAQPWDILDRDFSVKAWNVSPAWTLTKGTNIPTSYVTQQNDFVNINKTQAAGSYTYGFLSSPAVSLSANTAYTCEIKARVHAIDKNLFPDALIPPAGGTGGYEANQIGFILNGKNMYVYLTYGDENTGYLTPPVKDGRGTSPGYALGHRLNTSEWHVYRMIFNADNKTYDVYVDGELVFENLLLFAKNENLFAKIGGESWQRCNMDIEYVKAATGDLVNGNPPKIASAELSSDSHIAGNARTIRVTANTYNINNGETLQVSFTGEDGTAVAGISPVNITINSGAGAIDLTIPATVPLGKYTITVAAPAGQIEGKTMKPKSMQYVVAGVSPIDAKMLPQMKIVDYIRNLNDYKYYTVKKEFIFPSIVDTKQYTTTDGKFKNGSAPINRYYLYYAPHDNPGGIYLSTAPTLDGPWTEYDGSAGMTPGTVIDFPWAERQSDIIKNGDERHISACQVVWNEEQDKYIMYFHGPNTSTHYAASDDLINWTFGATILTANQFSQIGEEASYAKVFKHEVPGLGNKYVLFLMNQEEQIRKIYWAHSTDGINWTPVPKPLISPNLNYKKVPGTDRKPNFGPGNPGPTDGPNASGPFLMERDGRYFIICHDSNNNVMVVEVGESLDMEVHWGEYMTVANAVLNSTPTRIAAVDFIQDDTGKWYMFFEAGDRLGANIAYMKENSDDTAISPDLTGKVGKSAQYYTLTGIAASAISKGLLLKKTIYTDGSAKVEKIVNK